MTINERLETTTHLTKRFNDTRTKPKPSLVVGTLRLTYDYTKEQLGMMINN